MKNESRISVRTLTAMALLIAMSIVFSRVLARAVCGFCPEVNVVGIHALLCAVCHRGGRFCVLPAVPF